MPPPSELRERLAAARLQVLFTPALCDDPGAVLAALAGAVDVLQVRVKPPGSSPGPAPAAESYAWCERALVLAGEAEHPALVLVDDRVDVALALLPRGLAGVHLGQDDLAPADARGLLGPQALIGLSTHGPADVARAAEEPVDYLGFGPVFPTATKAYGRGLGPEAAWLAAESARVPVFPIGGIDHANANELARVGRAAVSSAVLSAPDPAAAARALRALLAEED